MFKKFFLLGVILLIVGCSREVKTPNNENINIDIENKNYQSEDKENKYEDDNPLKIGIYRANGNYNGKELIKDTYYASFSSMQDIESFEVFYTNDDVIYGSNFKSTWNNYYNKYEEDISQYKIGYNFKVILKDATSYEATLLKPDIFHFSDYFYIYFYDDVNAPDGQMYSHLEELSSNNIISSVKLFGVEKISDVQRITLTAFTYKDENDFDEEENYRGNSSYKINIEPK